MPETNPDYQKKQELAEARRSDQRKKAQQTIKKYNTGRRKGQAANAIREAKALVQSATPWGLLGLIMQIKPMSDWMYGLALFAAIFKDILDLIEASGILYVVVIVVTFCVSIFIFFMMLLGSIMHNSGGRAQQKMIRSYLILLGGTTVELLFGINFLPIETLTVLIIYALMLAARKQAAKEKKYEEKPWQNRAADNYEEEYSQAA